MTAVTVSPAAQIRRLRTELDAAHRLMAALVDALADPATEIAYRQALAREAASAGQDRAWSKGYAQAIADVKAVEHDLVKVMRLALRRSAPGGAVWLETVERHGGTEYGGANHPRVPVPTLVITAARQAAGRGAR